MLLGFCILFTGMFNMEAAVSPLSESPDFADLFASFSNPVIGVLVGAGVTAIIQSSSASIGILQALSSTGIITWSSAIPIILGQNIGTCITPILASIGASKNAKRTAAVHLSFNIIGTWSSWWASIRHPVHFALLLLGTAH
ncbi:MAG: Na/Pi symporter [Acutalibacteraceae bacterium]